MNEGLQLEWRFIDELRVLNLKGFECVSLVWVIVEGMMIFTKCARIEYNREEFELEIYNKKRWLIVAPFHSIFCRDPSSIPLPRSFHKEREWESFFS